MVFTMSRESNTINLNLLPHLETFNLADSRGVEWYHRTSTAPYRKVMLGMKSMTDETITKQAAGADNHQRIRL
jgi:hypothetical protein